MQNYEKTPTQLFQIATRRGMHVITRYSTVSNIWHEPCAIESIKPRHTICPRCHEILYDSKTTIPIGKHRRVEVQGLRCQRCDKFFTSSRDSVLDILRDNPYAKEFTFNGNYYWDYSTTQQKKIRRNKALSEVSRFPNLAMVIWVEWDNGQEDEFFIHYHTPPIERADLLTYSQKRARELLTASFYPNRGGHGVLENHTFRVLDVISENTKTRYNIQDFIPETLYIGKDGGFSSSTKDGNSEIVDLLVYSWRTDCYEIIRATYDRIDNQFYSDISLYRKFVEEYGRPEQKLRFISKGESFLLDAKGNLRDQSILMECGYSVAERDGMTTSERWKLLAEIVDLDILSVSKIVSLLTFFISSHPGKQYELARFKWSKDMEYIKTYNVNPDRFFIAKEKRGAAKRNC